jgi:hypothetical protein
MCESAFTQPWFHQQVFHSPDHGISRFIYDRLVFRILRQHTEVNGIILVITTIKLDLEKSVNSLTPNRCYQVLSLSD